ncbi:flavodoxin domain-containing protein [Ningiella sp. W23]|uniref:flavodoxin domain-containing protein n=1 Tax=Ningiella sp. W23 TaxID=3023715 RepID=UPI00375803C2
MTEQIISQSTSALKPNTQYFEIVVGSVLGASEYVADAVENKLHELGHVCNVHFQPAIADINFDNVLLVITSTHGAGDLPDNIQDFEAALHLKDLSSTRFAVIGLGDSSYDTFCQGALTMQDTITKSGASLLLPPIHIDVLHHPVPEDEALLYLNKVLATL